MDESLIGIESSKHAVPRPRYATEPMRKPKAIKREYVDEGDDGDGDSDFTPGESSREKKSELTMQITKKAKKKVKKEPTTTGDDDGEGGSKPTSQKIGFDITTGPVQDEGLQAKYKAMSLDELKQYMKVRRF